MLTVETPATTGAAPTPPSNGTNEPNLRQLEQRVFALEAEVARLKEELRSTSLQATSYRPDSSILPGTI